MGCSHSKKTRAKTLSAQSLSAQGPAPIPTQDKKASPARLSPMSMKMTIGTVASSSDHRLPEIFESLLQVESIQSSIALSNSVFSTLDNIRDLVLIADHSNVIQYVNSPLARLLQYNSEDLVGQPLMSFMENPEAAQRSIDRGVEWAGRFRWRARTGETISLQCRSLTCSKSTRPPNYNLFIFETLSDSNFPRGSVSSIRKGSCDLKSVISEGSARRQSLAKLSNLPLEAPITKVLTLLCAAQENAPNNVIQMLDEVIDILRTTELYTSQLKTDSLRAEDPITSDLIASLVAKGPPSSLIPRRSSDEHAARKKMSAKKNPFVALTVSRELKDALRKIDCWEFDVILTEKLSSGKPLVHVGLKIFQTFSANKVLSVDWKTIHFWLILMEENYHSSNSYHNSTHAADVLQAAACFLLKLRSKKLLLPIDEICCLIAAVGHDLGHPGKSSAFLTNSGDDLALLYNDICVLEQHHASLTFRLTLKEERCNILKGLKQATYSTARASVIDVILATDMLKHFEHFSKFVTVYSKGSDDNQEGAEKERNESLVSDISSEDIVVVKRMLIKCADVANPTRPLHLCKEWAKRIAEEYFAQTDEEKAKKLPVVMPHFDRNVCSIPRSQLGFMDYIVNNMFEEWDAFLEMPETLYNLRKNYEYWKEVIENEETTPKNVEPRAGPSSQPHSDSQ